MLCGCKERRGKGNFIRRFSVREKGDKMDFKFADTTFKLIFQSLEGIQNLLSFLGMDCEISDIEKKMITSTIFESRENDLSFLLNQTYYYFMEHQSSNCPNMPFRLLLYIVEGLQDIARMEMKQMKESKKVPKTSEASEITLLYSDKLIHLPEIKCYNFLTGIVPVKQVKNDISSDMRLSDAYKSYNRNNTKNFDLELVVHSFDLRITKEEAVNFYDNHKVPERFGTLEYELIQYAMLVGTYKGICRLEKNTITSNRAEKVIRDILLWLSLIHI